MEKKERTRGLLVPILFWPVFLGVTLVATLIYSLVAGLDNLSTAAALVITFVSNVATFFALKAIGHLDPQEFFWRKPKLKHAVLSIMAGLGLFFLLQLLAVALNSWTSLELASSDTSTSITSIATGTGGVIFALLMTAFGAPLTEELLFRGALMGATLRFAKPWVAILISGLFFSAGHFQGFSNFTDIFTLLWTFSLGVINGVLAFKTKSILNPMLLHCSYNFITLTLSS